MKSSLRLICALSVLMWIAPNLCLASNWERIQPEDTVTIIHPSGEQETVTPSCALQTIDTPYGTLPNDFAFFFEQGESDNLLIYFNGGGACWNDATCLVSLALAFDDDALSNPTYNPSMYDENDPEVAGGIFSDSDENPFKTWSKVFIPYCTGDLHLGSKETSYTDTTGLVTGYPGTPVTFQHRGYDNAMAVREWLKQKLSNDLDPKHILMSGSSAGGYGATFNFPHFQEITNIKINLLSDGAMGIVSSGFVNQLLDFNGNWGIENTLARNFHPLIGRFSAHSLNKQVFIRLAYQYPWNRFAQYTTGTDIIQMQFLKITDQIDNGNLNPSTWGLGETDYNYIIPWQIIMNSSVHLLSAFTWNYQFYVGEGTCHTIMTDFCEQNAFPVSSPSPFYNEQSAKNIVFRDWLYDFATQRRFREKSVAYYH
jgi:hypothetical protein